VDGRMFERFTWHSARATSCRSLGRGAIRYAIRNVPVFSENDKKTWEFFVASF
jgi:hypothetical protein